MLVLNSVKTCMRLWSVLREKNGSVQIHSVFSSAVNLIGDDIFFSILTDRHGLYPMSCSVRSEISFTEYGLQAGMKMLIENGVMSVLQAELQIRTNGSAIRDLSVSSVRGLRIPDNLAAKVTLLKELLWEHGSEDDLSTLVTGKYQNPYADFVKKRLAEFEEVIQSGDVSAAGRAGELAGCGIGLTPSSDDLIVGYLSSYLADSKAKEKSSKASYKIVNAIGNEAAKHTNVISGAFLRQCGQGLLSEDMLSLLRALYSGAGSEEVLAYGRGVLSYGSSSGTDILTGVVLAITALQGGE
jgi:hypothetical protein